MAFDWKSLLGSIAPTVATALGGPLAGLAVEAVGNALGMDAPTQKKIQDALTQAPLSADQIVALKTAEQNLLVRMRELDIQEDSLYLADVANARGREESIKDNTVRILAYSIIGAFIAVVGGTLMGYTKVDSVLAGTLIGYLSAKAEQVMSYYFGSTKNSARTSELLAQSTPKDQK